MDEEGAKTMEYRLNPLAWNNMFAVPCEVVDEHIRLAGSVQLKVLLWSLRHVSDTFKLEDISAALGVNGADICDAMQYWCEHGIMYKVDDDKFALQAPSTKKDVQTLVGPEKTSEIVVEKTEKKAEPLPIIKPDADHINHRVSESSALRHLYSEMQAKLGRTIGHKDQATILMMHDDYGLPVEVILMILNYSVLVGKGNLRYMNSVAMNWSEREIVTLEMAEHEIQRLTVNDSIWSAFRKKTDLENKNPTKRQMELLEKWAVQWGFPMNVIHYAYEAMIDGTGGKVSLPYMDKILENWRSEGFATIAQIQRNQREHQENTQNKKKAKMSVETKKSSYDLDAFIAQSQKTPKREGK